MKNKYNIDFSLPAALRRCWTPKVAAPVTGVGSGQLPEVVAGGGRWVEEGVEAEEEVKVSGAFASLIKSWDAGMDLDRPGSPLDAQSLANANAQHLSADTVRLLRPPSDPRLQTAAPCAVAVQNRVSTHLGAIDWDFKSFIQIAPVQPQPDVPREASHAFFGTYNPTRTASRRAQGAVCRVGVEQPQLDEPTPPASGGFL